MATTNPLNQYTLPGALILKMDAVEAIIILIFRFFIDQEERMNIEHLKMNILSLLLKYFKWISAHITMFSMAKFNNAMLFGAVIILIIGAIWHSDMTFMAVYLFT